jgi:hypothetical protein
LSKHEKYYQDILLLSAKAPAQDLEEEAVTFRKAKVSEISEITGVNTNCKLWDDVTLDETVTPSDCFLKQYQTKCRVWSMNSEASRRTFLDLFFQDVVGREEFHSELRIFCELSLTTAATTVGNKRLKLTGKHDYTIGHAGGLNIREYSVAPDSHIIAVEAKKAWDDTDIWQCIAEAAALYKTRKDAGKLNCNVWGICSNASSWKFVHIDNGGQVWESQEYSLMTPRYDYEKILKVYRFVHHVVRACYRTSPTTTPHQSLEALIE